MNDLIIRLVVDVLGHLRIKIHKPGGVRCLALAVLNIPATFTPPAQGQRVRFFAQEVAPNTAAPVPYTWAALKPDLPYCFGNLSLHPGTHWPLRSLGRHDRGVKQSHKMTIESVVVNPQLDDSLFAAPKST